MNTTESRLSKSEEIPQLYDWIVDTIQPLINGRIFEIHSGKGEISSRLIDQGFSIQLNAVSDDNREYLRQTFQTSYLVRGIHNINFLQQELEEKYLHFESQFPIVLVCNDFEEHLTYDRTAVAKAKRLVAERGRLIIVGQCPNTLFPGSNWDDTLLKRYNRDFIFNLLGDHSILKIKFFNCIGACFIAMTKKL